MSTWRMNMATSGTPRRRGVHTRLRSTAAAIALALAGVFAAALCGPDAVALADSIPNAQMARQVGTTAETSAVSSGWLRVAHLSPDTGGVDVRVVAEPAGNTAFTLTDVTYGAVSSYQALAPGAYQVD